MNNEYEIKSMKLLIDEMKDTIDHKKEYIGQLEQRIKRAIEYVRTEWYSKNTKDIEKMVSFNDWRIDLYNILTKGSK